jgi:hypothetical protein
MRIRGYLIAIACMAMATVACEKPSTQEGRIPKKQDVIHPESGLRPIVNPTILEQLRQASGRRADSTSVPRGARGIDTSYGRPIIDYTDADVVWLSDRIKHDNPAMFAQCVVPRWNAFSRGAELMWPNYLSEVTPTCSPMSMLTWRVSESQRIAWQSTSQTVRDKLMTSLGQYVLGANMPTNTRLVVVGLDYGSLNTNPYDSVTTSIVQFPDSNPLYTITCHRIR